MRSLGTGWAFLVCTWLATSGGLADDSTSRKLRYKLRPDQILQYKLKRQSVLTLPVEDGSLDIKQTLLLETRLEVTEGRPGSAAKLKQTFGRVRLTVEFSNGAEFAYDSDDREEGKVPEVLREALDALADESTEITVSENGSVTDVDPSADLRSALRTLGMGPLQMGGVLSTSGLRELAQQWFFVLPKLAPYKGQKWKHSEIRRLTGEVFLNQDNTYRYTGQERVRGVRVVRFGMDAGASVNEKSTAAAGVWNVQGTGVVLFDPKRGRTLRSESETRYRVRWEAPDGKTKRTRIQVRSEIRTIKGGDGRRDRPRTR